MPKIVDHVLYREELLNKSLPVFVRKGVSGVSMRDLAGALEISTGTLYHYFPTKEILFTSMVHYIVKKDAQEIAAISQSSDVLNNLIQFISAKEDHFKNIILLALDVKRHHSQSMELTQIVDDSWNSYVEELTKIFRTDQIPNSGEVFLSFFVGALVLKYSKSKVLSWSELLEGFGQISHFIGNVNKG